MGSHDRPSPRRSRTGGARAPRSTDASIEADAPQDAIQAVYARLGGLIVRFRYLVVATWLIIAVAANLGLPSLASVTNYNDSSFLPSDQPSVRAAQLAAPFQHGTLPQAVLVAGRSDGPLTTADEAAITRAEAAVRRIAGVVDVRDRGMSRDGQARKAQITLIDRAQGMGANPYVDAIRATFARKGGPAGLSFYLTGEVATSVDNAAATAQTDAVIQLAAVVAILALLFVIYRALLAPILTFLPPLFALLTAGPVIAESHKLFGIPVSDFTQLFLIVVVLGAGADYGLFFVFRLREERRRGLGLPAAVTKSLSRVGETITFSAGTVIAAVLCLLLASFGLYQGLGPATAMGFFLLLLAGLTLLPALFAIFGDAAFWPAAVRSRRSEEGAWGRIARRVVERPAPVLLAGVALFGGLAGYGLHGYAPAAFGSGPTAASSQSARGTRVLLAHFPAGEANPTSLLLRYATPVWNHPAVLTRLTRLLAGDSLFSSTSGPLDPNGTPLSATQLQRLHATLGPAAALPLSPPFQRGTAGAGFSPALFTAYRATPQFISPDGRTVQFYATLRAGAPDSTGAMQAIQRVRIALTAAGRATGAVETGVTGQAAFAYDSGAVTIHDQIMVVPVVLIALAVLLAIVLRSLVAPLYLIVSVGLSYLGALGLVVVVFEGIGHGSGLTFVLPFIMFIFLMALGSDYNILVMSRIREEALRRPLPEAVTRAVGATGGTVTSAGIVLAASFYVLTLGGGTQGQQVGLGISGGILMDTFLVRTLLIPSTVVLLRRWNWWPAQLAAEPVIPAPFDV